MDNAATYWYHPHLHGKTMSQVLKGAAGLIIVQDSTESALTLPRTYGVDDIPLVFQFLTINNATKQIAINDELDNTVLVNGSLTANALLNVPAQMVRLRLLNASSHRFFDFGFNDNRTFSQITSDDGLLNAPVSLTKLVLAPGERAEILVDFANQQGSTFYLKQYGTQLPSSYPGGPQGMMGMALGPLDNTNFNLLQINVVAPTANPITTLPNTLTNNTVWSQVGASTRNIAITASPMMSMTNFLMNGVKYNHDIINFTTQQENVEIWNITNQSMMPHPFHIHGNHFYVLDINGVTPPANMQGRKDVVTIPPMNGTVRIITKYQDFSDSTMPYMYHCHILSHEDTGMMGQFIVNGAANGTNEISENNALFIYPNPINSNTDVLTVQSENNINNIAIFDVLGRQISTQKINGKQITLAVPIANGFYIVQVKTDQTTLSQKIVVTH
jgi:bilirubin oxidase